MQDLEIKKKKKHVRKYSQVNTQLLTVKCSQRAGGEQRPEEASEAKLDFLFLVALCCRSRKLSYTLFTQREKWSRKSPPSRNQITRLVLKPDSKSVFFWILFLLAIQGVLTFSIFRY